MLPIETQYQLEKQKQDRGGVFNVLDLVPVFTEQEEFILQPKKGKRKIQLPGRRVNLNDDFIEMADFEIIPTAEYQPPEPKKKKPKKSQKSKSKIDKNDIRRVIAERRKGIYKSYNIPKIKNISNDIIEGTTMQNVIEYTPIAETVARPRNRRRYKMTSAVDPSFFEPIPVPAVVRPRNRRQYKMTGSVDPNYFKVTKPLPPTPPKRVPKPLPPIPTKRDRVFLKKDPLDFIDLPLAPMPPLPSIPSEMAI